MKRFIALVVGVEMVLLVIVANTGQAHAQVPGTNGRIVFARFDPTLGGTVTYTANPDGSHVQRLFPGTSGFPHWAPDGSEVAVVCCDKAAVIVNADSGSFRELEMQDPSLFMACPVWSPDGSRLACGAFDDADSSRNGIYTIRSSDGGGMMRITSNPGGDDEIGDYSPDGKRLVFVRTDQSGAVTLFVVRLNGIGLRQITPSGLMPNPEEGGSWSPQGDKILFSMRTAPDRRFSIWIVNADGSDLHSISMTPSCGGEFSDSKSVGCSEARWSPDGSKIVFVRNSKATPKDIYTVNVDGSGLTQATHVGFDEFPDWGTHPLAT